MKLSDCHHGTCIRNCTFHDPVGCVTSCDRCSLVYFILQASTSHILCPVAAMPKANREGDAQLKRCRQKVPPCESMLKSPDPKKLKKVAKALKEGKCATPSTATSSTKTPESILKAVGAPPAMVARKLSFGSPTTHDIEAENKPRKPSTPPKDPQDRACAQDRKCTLAHAWVHA